MAEYVGLRHGEYWERIENGDYYCGGCGWKVTDHDSFCHECGGALHEYALGQAQGGGRMTEHDGLERSSATEASRTGLDPATIARSLRRMAGDGSMEWVTCPIRASVLRDAADTIWQLRDDLQRANAENAKLRELLQEAVDAASLKDIRDWRYGKRLAFLREARVLGVEVDG